MRIGTPDIAVGPSEGRGRGVFAVRRFEPGEIIEVCPVIALSASDGRTLDGTALHNYYFGWGEDRTQAAIVLGYGSIYNHSFTPNAKHSKDSASGTMSIIAVRTIDPGDEIFIRYETGAGENAGRVWFEVR